jgi:serine/threonine protein kinase
MQEGVHIGRDVLAALDYTHSSEVIHRDVKRGNILLDDDRALVCDFGIAPGGPASGRTPLASSKGSVLGTRPTRCRG